MARGKSVPYGTLPYHALTTSPYLTLPGLSNVLVLANHQSKSSGHFSQWQNGVSVCCLLGNEEEDQKVEEEEVEEEYEVCRETAGLIHRAVKPALLYTAIDHHPNGSIC